jgi:hypothetical protein
MSSFCFNIHRWIGVSTRRGAAGQDGYEERCLFERKRREEKRREEEREGWRGMTFQCAQPPRERMSV